MFSVNVIFQMIEEEHNAFQRLFYPEEQKRRLEDSVVTEADLGQLQQAQRILFPLPAKLEGCTQTLNSKENSM